MLERVERAFCAAIGRDPDACIGYYEVGIRAAIEAMRELIEVVDISDVYAALDHRYNGEQVFGPEEVIAVWQAMFDVLLRDKPKGSGKGGGYVPEKSGFNPPL